MPNFNDRRPGYPGGDLPDKFNCPSCGGFIPNNETPGAYPGAISRKDGKTEICSNCGTLEAFQDYFMEANKPDFTNEDKIRDFRKQEAGLDYGETGTFGWNNPDHYLDSPGSIYAKDAGNPLHYYDEKSRRYECPDCGRSNMSGAESRKHQCGPGEEGTLV